MKKTMELERITPALAEKWLNQNPTNRKLRPGRVEMLAADMLNGLWTECVAPIVFYDDGTLADGQHRLWAIVDSEKPQEFYVIRNFPRPAGLNVDTGLGRTIVDNARISGADPGLSNQLVAMAIFYGAGSKTTKVTTAAASPAKKLEIVAKYREPCEWALHNGPNVKWFRNAVVFAAIARAYAHGEDPERLKQFSFVVAKGLADGKDDSAAVAVRNYIITKGRKFGPAEHHDLFLRVQNAIWYFIRRKQLNVLRPLETECYPLKTAKKLAKAA